MIEAAKLTEAKRIWEEEPREEYGKSMGFKVQDAEKSVTDQGEV